jgi:hypothetical protein
MLLISPLARVLTCLIALLLLIPVAGIRLQDEARLVQFHNRNLNVLPPPDGFMRDPVEFFRQAKSWLADRAYPIQQASLLQKKILFHAFKTPPQRRISLGSDGFIFVNGGSEETVNGILANVCMNSHDEAMAAQLRGLLPSVIQFASSRGMAVDVVIVPTSMTLYADRLPTSVPQIYRDACRERMQGHSPLLTLTAPPGLNFVYPLQAMKSASSDEAFFPKGNWHPTGMSLKVVRDSYLDALHVGKTVDDRLERGMGPSEIMNTYGIDVELPVYFVRNPRVQFDAARNATFNTAIRERFTASQATTRAYANAAPLLEESVLMLSDSYGEFSSEVFAGAFRNVVQVTSNNLSREHVVDVVDRSAAAFKIDRLILLVQEGGVGNLVVWANAFAAAPAMH